MASSTSGDEAARLSGGAEVESPQGSQIAGEQHGWTDEDWRLWNSGQWRAQDGADSPHGTEYHDLGNEHGDGRGNADQVRRRSSSWWSSTASPQDDPWQRWSDPWNRQDTWSASGHGWRGSTESSEQRVGGQDKISVPEFTAEEDKDGGKAKSYLRKIEAWRRVTRLPPQKQALMLYNGLSGKAWRDAEELDLTILDAANGVDKFIAWIAERYLDKEVVKAGKYMSDFFKSFKKTADQDIRDYNMEFDRHLAKLKEIGCLFPGVCSSWWYIDKLRLDNAAELSLLSSVGNQYDLPRLQEAAVVQDRMNRRIWEHNRKNELNGKKPEHRRGHQALCTELEDIPDDEDAMDDIELYDEDVHSEENDPEAHEAFVAFQNAKAKYNDVLKARGTNTGSREESLARAKARSYCSACGKKGHWHRDPDCPKNKTKVSGPTPHTTHLVYYTDGDPLDVIVDCACTRTLAGSAWVRAYIDLLKDYKIDYIIVEQDEALKFGGPKIYPLIEGCGELAEEPRQMVHDQDFDRGCWCAFAHQLPCVGEVGDELQDGAQCGELHQLRSLRCAVFFQWLWPPTSSCN